MKILFAFTALFLLHFACKKEDKSSGATTTSSSSTSTTSTTIATVKCDTSVVPDNRKNGCYPRLVTPSMCETIDLSVGKLYEFAWTTDGSVCETPWTFQIAGNPITPQNIKSWSLSTNVSIGITQNGGIINVNLANLDGLTTDNGLYHWTVSSFYDSYPASKTFKVKK